jgi:aminoglycoside phosphotransferase (APT) family kinase protein
MKPQWEADFEITTAKASMLIASQFPGLQPVQIAPLGAGWDNAAFLVNERFVFRFPRREIAAPLIVREARILPLLAPHLPVSIPVSEYSGAPADGYPYAFAGYPLIPGQTACRCVWSERERENQAPVLARFLASLHGIPVDRETAAWAPGDEIERANVQQRAPKLKERLRARVLDFNTRQVNALTTLVDALAAAPLQTRPYCWVHGDFYARHLLYHAGRFTGVIDWGDVHLGDPAVDLSIAFSFLPPVARVTFREVYGEIDEATWQRARFRAIHYGAILTEYGAGTGDEAIRAAGEYALQFAPVD